METIGVLDTEGRDELLNLIYDVMVGGSVGRKDTRSLCKSLHDWLGEPEVGITPSGTKIATVAKWRSKYKNAAVIKI